MNIFKFVVAASALALLGACKSAPEPKSEDRTSMLDEEIDLPEARESKSSLTEVMLFLPETPSEPSLEIDGKSSDWQKGKFRTFRKKSDVESGESFWSGEQDAGFRVGIDGDEGFAYFLVEVKDDALVDPQDGEISDAVVLHLRDPGLDSLQKALPRGVGLQDYVDAETSLVFTPDGHVDGFESSSFREDAVIHAVDRRKNGWVVEIALALEVLEEVSTIPLPEIAFRVELLDGDEADRPGTQTVMSTLPETGDGSPRMAIYTVGGLLPHAKLGQGPPRMNALGRWKLEDTWNFASFEVVPKYWVTLEDPDAFAKALRDSDALDDICGVARKDIHLIEAYQSRGGNYRAGLVLCGQRATKGRCSSGATSNLLWVALEPASDGWSLRQAVNVFDKPLEQCTFEASGKAPVYEGFSLFPLDVLGTDVWMVGWTETLRERGHDREVSGVTFLRTDYEKPIIGSVKSRMKDSYAGERTITESNVYLTYVDDDDNVDICQVEDVMEQACDGLDHRCTTFERGKYVLTHIQMWNAKNQRFERYELSKHPGCTYAFDFSQAEAYMLLQVKGRIGLLPSPRSNEEEDEGLDIF